MNYLDLKVGDKLPARPVEDRRGAQSGAMSEPSWFVLNCHSNSERGVKDDLVELGVDEAWFPTKKITWRPSKGPLRNKLQSRITACVAGYVLFRVSGFPQWDLLLQVDHVIRALGGVNPIRLRDEDIMGMNQMPKRLQDLVDAEREAMTIKVGDPIEIVAGAMTGWTCRVSGIGPVLLCEVDFLGGPRLIKVRPEFARKVKEED